MRRRRWLAQRDLPRCRARARLPEHLGELVGVVRRDLVERHALVGELDGVGGGLHELLDGAHGGLLVLLREEGLLEARPELLGLEGGAVEVLDGAEELGVLLALLEELLAGRLEVLREAVDLGVVLEVGGGVALLLPAGGGNEIVSGRSRTGDAVIARMRLYVLIGLQKQSWSSLRVGTAHGSVRKVKGLCCLQEHGSASALGPVLNPQNKNPRTYLSSSVLIDSMAESSLAAWRERRGDP